MNPHSHAWQCHSVSQRDFICIFFPTGFRGSSGAWRAKVGRTQRRSEAFRALEEVESQFVDNLAGDIRGWISKSTWLF